MSDRVIPLGSNLAAIPERLLLAHARGEVLFIAGAGISQPAGLPDFRGLVLQVYAQLDAAVNNVLNSNPGTPATMPDSSGLTYQQSAEVSRFTRGDYDVVLGMLERRMDGHPHGKSSVRQAVSNLLRKPEISTTGAAGGLTGPKRALLPAPLQGESLVQTWWPLQEQTVSRRFINSDNLYRPILLATLKGITQVIIVRILGRIV